MIKDAFYLSPQELNNSPSRKHGIDEPTELSLRIYACHKFISNYIAALGAPPELRQEAWNLANDSLRTTLCVRFKSEVVACGVVYAAARRFQVPLPENPPWWEAFDADKSGIDEVCRVLAHLYSLPKPHYIAVCKQGGEAWDPHPMSKEDFLSSPPTKDDPKTATKLNI